MQGYHYLFNQSTNQTWWRGLSAVVTLFVNAWLRFAVIVGFNSSRKHAQYTDTRYRHYGIISSLQPTGKINHLFFFLYFWSANSKIPAAKTECKLRCQNKSGRPVSAVRQRWLGCQQAEKETRRCWLYWPIIKVGCMANLNVFFLLQSMFDQIKSTTRGLWVVSPSY